MSVFLRWIHCEFILIFIWYLFKKKVKKKSFTKIKSNSNSISNVFVTRLPNVSLWMSNGLLKERWDRIQTAALNNGN